MMKTEWNKCDRNKIEKERCLIKQDRKEGRKWFI